MIRTEFGDSRVSKVPAAGTRIADVPAVDSLKMLLDYAMAEGKELGLPEFVSLLRMASLELGRTATHAPKRARRGRPAPRAAGRNEERVVP